MNGLVAVGGGEGVAVFAEGRGAHLAAARQGAQTPRLGRVGDVPQLDARVRAPAGGGEGVALGV
ncbi:hypothetical protein [Frankia sp. CiP3]|uniref:hypothetical protein n=1 Tax=Frankia sp. CiP3 TaxID=2880971 RepID=UPI001EF62D6B|nr:hypothetical protein [Frankia sp. CiP3]